MEWIIHILPKAGDDFVAEKEIEVILSNDVRSQNISITIEQDEIGELESCFTVVLDKISLVNPNTNAVFQPDSEQDKNRLQFDISEATVCIQDDDGNV